MSGWFTPDERGELLRLARWSLERIGSPVGTGYAISFDLQRFNEPRAAFVTLTRRGELRGCVGSLLADRPLSTTVAELAMSSATEDPRFPRVTREEVCELHIEISVLSPLRDARPEEVVVGTHGLIVERGRRRGLLLPQVATEHHLDREQFLDAVCQKAGLPPNAWKKPETKLQTFTAEVFGEEP